MSRAESHVAGAAAEDQPPMDLLGVTGVRRGSQAEGGLLGQVIGCWPRV